MYDRPQAVEHLRSLRYLNHEPLRQPEREWLDRIFIRPEISDDWLGVAATSATDEEAGFHVENHLQAPCRCLDSVVLKLRGCEKIFKSR